ncbi:transposable element Tcb2 transposase [Trichonephila clavipes]|nr:transposable element Tcb2 transposase [Trichonephila clavipes]
MSPIEHEWDIVGRRIARDLRPVASTDELWLRIQTIWNTLPQTDIQNVFNSMPRPVCPPVRLVEGEERWEAPEHTMVLPQNWDEIYLNRSVTCMDGAQSYG